MTFLLLIITGLLLILVLLVAFRAHPSGERPRRGTNARELKVAAVGVAVLAGAWLVTTVVGG